MVTMADISREGIVLAGGGRALLLQLAHPAVGEGVARHSDFASDPMRRLHGTLTFVYAIALGTDEDARAVRRTVNRAHVPVRGPGYNAMDPALQLWVAATLYDTAISMFERVFGPLGEEAGEAVYREYAVLGTALQMPPELWPQDRAAFAAYFDDQVARLSVDDTVRGVQRTLFGSIPFGLRRLVGLVSVGLLPPSVREQFGFDWDERRERRFGRVLSSAIWVYRLLPGRVRSWPSRHYLARLRG